MHVYAVQHFVAYKYKCVQNAEKVPVSTSTCSVGSFWNVDTDVDTCEPWPVGSYQNQPYQKFCLLCASGQITIDLTGQVSGAVTGATSEDQNASCGISVIFLL